MQINFPSLRSWQKQALKTYIEAKKNNKNSLLWEATPGAGKTIAALYLCLQECSNDKSSKIIIVVPTTHLKLQWARAASTYKINLDINYTEKNKTISKDYHGAVLTYQQIGNKPKSFNFLTNNSVVVLDEIHHAGDGLTWGNALRTCLKNSKFILCLSGTAFRSDSNTIPFVSYDHIGVSNPDYVYSYAKSVSERVCRPTVFITYGGEVSWEESGNSISATFNDSVEKSIRTKRLKTALNENSGWIDPMLSDANNMISALRSEHPDAGGLLVASSQDHAKGLAKTLRSITGEKPITVLSDDPSANNKIKLFSSSKERWLVACNMVSEGVDIPRLRVGVYATTIKTKMYFRQFLGRIVRKTDLPKGVQTAFFYLPADPVLKKLAHEIEEEQKHYTKTIEEEWQKYSTNKKNDTPHKESWQPLKSINSGVDSIITSGGQMTFWQHQEERIDINITSEYIDINKVELTKSELKLEIAKEIRSLVTKYHKNTGQPHAHIHYLLNKTQGLKSQNECTEKQLVERLSILSKLINYPK